MQYLFFHDWAISLSIMFSNFIHIAATYQRFYLFKNANKRKQFEMLNNFVMKGLTEKMILSKDLKEERVLVNQGSG